jgi:hypothetical protein
LDIGMVYVPDSRTSLPIEATPEIASRLGIIAAQAAYLEDQMERLFCSLMGADSAKSALVFKEIAGRRRRDILAAMLAETEPRDVAKALVALIQNEVKTAFTRRNDLVHATFGAWDVKADKLARVDSITGGGQPVILTPKALDEDIRYLATTNAAFEWLCLALLDPSLAKPLEQRGHPIP